MEGCHELIHADCLDWMREQADNTVDLVFGSPPYEDARTYGMDFRLKGQDWVDWLLPRIIEAVRICRGLVAMVVEGRQRKFRWSATPALLMADLHRAGVHLRKPPVFHRVGIPGSGGQDWWRNDFEFIVCATSGGKLPWSENTAMGHPPKWAPGGEMSYRLGDGTRVNQWGGRSSSTGMRRSCGKRRKHFRPSHRAHNKRRADGEMEVQSYEPPVLANPGNVIQEQLSINDWWSIIHCYAHATQANPSQILRTLQSAVDAQEVPEWLRRVDSAIYGAEILWADLHGHGIPRTELGSLPWLPEGFPPEECKTSVLQPGVLRSGQRDLSAAGTEDCEGEKRSPSQTPKDKVQGVRPGGSPSDSPPRRGRDEQHDEQPQSSLSLVSPQEACKAPGRLPAVWASCKAVQGLWEFVRHALPTLQKAWRSVTEGDGIAALSTPHDCSGVISCKVGGGHMGSPLAHLNEAPFPEKLAEVFVRSFCPPNGIVLDPFAGSGTTLAVARYYGRRSIGIEIRESQVDLCRKRLTEARERYPLFENG